MASGSWAKDLARAESLRAWLAEHPPSRRIWSHALESLGYRQAAEAKLVRKASRSLPSLAEETGAAWMTDDSGWIALFAPGAEHQGPVFYCLECERPPEGWLPLGQGWEAFDPALERAQEAASRRKPRINPRRVVSDPYELRY